jgi:hypothetical protein
LLIVSTFKYFLPLKIRDHFRWVKHPYYSFLRLCIILRSRRRILSGPFKNIHFGLPNFNTAMMLGTWEKELHTILSDFKLEGPLICIGAAEGYYAIGLAKIHKHSIVYAYETLELYQSFLRKNARINRITNIDIRGTCNINSLHEVLDKTKEPPLILCDIEGGEIELLDLDKIPRLSNAYILVEVHEMYVENCENKLLSRFRSTHNAVVIEGKKRTVNDLPKELNFLKYFVPENRINSLMSEGRPYPMNWIWFIPLSQN